MEGEVISNRRNREKGLASQPKSEKKRGEEAEPRGAASPPERAALAELAALLAPQPTGAAGAERAGTLVEERFDIEPFPDFSAK